MLNYYPMQTGTKWTPDVYNNLVRSIQDGTAFTVETELGTTMLTYAARITALESRVSYLSALTARDKKREQVVLSANQTSVNLEKTPVLDSEMLSRNGTNLSKTGTPPGFVGDYILTPMSSLITFNPDLVALIKDGDVLVVVYDYEVA